MLCVQSIESCFYVLYVDGYLVTLSRNLGSKGMVELIWAYEVAWVGNLRGEHQAVSIIWMYVCSGKNRFHDTNIVPLGAQFCR